MQSPSLEQSLHLMNAADVRSKLATPEGRADVGAKSGRPDAETLREFFLAAYSREPGAEELKVAAEYLARPRADPRGKPLDPAVARRAGFEDLLWALINTKEFLYNH